MAIVAGLMVAVSCAVGVALTALMLPGIWLMIAVAFAVDLWRPELIPTWALVGAVLLGLLAELLEFVASAAGARRARGSRGAAIWSIIGGVIGAIVGTVLIPILVIGTVMGGIIGAGLAALLAERSFANQGWTHSWRVGRGAATGRFYSVLIKLSLAGAIALLLTTATLL